MDPEDWSLYGRRQGKSTTKKRARKFITEQVWSDKTHWTVQYGELKRPRGRPPAVGPLFEVVGEKLSLAGLTSVKKHLLQEGSSTNGVYVAHNSMGNARYVGRGNIFTRLKAHAASHPLELVYFSFYVVVNKAHAARDRNSTDTRGGPTATLQ